MDEDKLNEIVDEVEDFPIEEEGPVEIPVEEENEEEEWLENHPDQE